MTASLSGVYSLQELTDVGVLGLGFRLYTYISGTTTQKTAYTDAAGSVAHTYTSDGAGGLYIALNARGEIPAPLYLTTGSYDITLKRADGSTVWTRRADPIADVGVTLSASFAASGGSALMGFLQSGTGAVIRTVQDDLRDRVSPMQFGGNGTGAVDDAAAITKALAVGRHVDMSGKTWLINSTVSIPANTHIDLRGANIVAATGATPIFSFLAGAKGLTIQHSGGTISGTASCFLFAEGVTTTPASASDFAGQIHLHGVMVSSATITTALLFSKAVKSVYLHGCNFFTINGISSTGKGVEVMVSDSIIYGATGAAGTVGIKLRSSAGTIYYNEGWSFTNCTIDGFETAHDIADYFVYTLTGGYHSSIAAGHVIVTQAPTTTTLSDELTLGGGIVLGSSIRFAASAGGQAYNAHINATFNGVTATAISLENNAANITISGKFKNGATSPIGIVGAGNNANIVCRGIDFDSTYTGGVILNGASGAGCSIRGITYAGSGDPFYVARPVLINDVPIQTTNGAGFKRQFNPADLAGNYAAAAVISTMSITAAKGESGWIVASLPCTGMNAATQRFDLAVPTGMTIPSGTGWGSTFNYPSAAGALVCIRTPYYCTADVSGTLSITNAVGNTVTLNSHGFFGIERAF